jgi:hypothetical protein
VTIHRGVWRLDPTGAVVVAVYPSSTPTEPDYWEFVDYYDEDGEPKYTRDELYESAMIDHQRDKAAWKLWTYSIHQLSGYAKTAYADTMEEAMALADVVLRDDRVLLVPSSNPPVPA